MNEKKKKRVWEMSLWPIGSLLDHFYLFAGFGITIGGEFERLYLIVVATLSMSGGSSASFFIGYGASALRIGVIPYLPVYTVPFR